MCIVNIDNNDESDCIWEIPGNTTSLPHDAICEECSKPLPAGTTCEVYRKYETDEDGEPDYSHYVGEVATCPVCVEVRDVFCCDGWTFGSVMDDIYCAMDSSLDFNAGCLDGLSAEAIEVISDMIEGIEESWRESHDEDENETGIVDEDGRRHYKEPADEVKNPCFYRATWPEAVERLRKYWTDRKVAADAEAELCRAKLAEAEGM